MDKIDKKLVTLLQENARMPLKSLAEQVFLSSPAVSARIERLEEEGIIQGYEAKINQLKIGYHITAFINLEVAPARKPELPICAGMSFGRRVQLRNRKLFNAS